jgi:non-specific serine/threonine protein kinase/serine/threonine-protein kinase
MIEAFLPRDLLSMHPEHWNKIKAALQEVVTRSEDARAEWLADLRRSDPVLCAEIESILAAEAAAGEGFLARPLPVVPGAPAHAGARLSAYELLGPIGAGGMGEVWRAVRTDAYHQEVAIKLVRALPAGGSRFIAERLRAERQILARLSHPNIARLLDGGTTEGGVPYLVMELIQGGQPITAHCDALHLGTGARLELFLQVCEAVQYAHQHMVIHRDLKPSNILVGADGTPKLLDFGLAKLLEGDSGQPGADDTTVSTLRVLTPSYASPEQLRGEPVTTATDVFSLGVILHELLTGVRPYATDRSRPDGTFDLGSEPSRPSSQLRRRREPAATAPAARDAGQRAAARSTSPERLQRQLRGDLDNIILMALRPRPEQRYATVEQLARDIRLHLARQPISARKPTFAYHTLSFIARHRAAVITACALAVALIAGIIITTREAQLAQAESRRAQQRFDDVRHLASTLIFDIHDSMADLAGAAASRRLLIKTALSYLDRLSRESAGDAGLQGELAQAYMRLGDLQGRPREPSEGDYAGAQRAYRQAFDLYRAAIAIPGPEQARLRADFVVSCGKLSDAQWYRLDPDGALFYAQQAEDTSRLLHAASPRDLKARRLLATSLLDHGYKLFLIRGELPHALALLSEAIPELTAIAAATPGEPRSLRLLALAHTRLADALIFQHRTTEALESNRRALQILSALHRDAPDNTDFALLEAFAERQGGQLLLQLGQVADASVHAQAALDAYRTLAAADPGVAIYHINLAPTLTLLGQIALRRGHPQAALDLTREAVTEVESLDGESGGVDLHYERAEAEGTLGDLYVQRAAGAAGRAAQERNWESARHWYTRTRADLAAVLAASSLARELAAANDRQLELCEHKLAQLRGASGL